MKQCENMFKDAKVDAEGYANIRIRVGFSTYMYVKAKPMPLTKVDIKETADGLDAESATDVINEICRINLTCFKFNSIKEVVDLLGDADPICYDNDKDYNNEYVCYWNGSERAWKFDWDMVANAGLEEECADISEMEDEDDERLEKLFKLTIEDLYEPHVDDAGNYGDESVHAVYGMNELKALVNSVYN